MTESTLALAESGYVNLPTPYKLGLKKIICKNSKKYRISVSAKKLEHSTRPWPCTVKLFTVVIDTVLWKDGVLVSVSYFHPSLVFVL